MAEIPSPKTWKPPLIVLCGMGMGKADLSLHAQEWIGRAEVLAGGKRQLNLFGDHAGEKIVLEAPLEEVLEHLTCISPEKRTLVLASGDPFFFGIGRKLISAFGKERVFGVPNVTSVQVLCSRLCEPWEDLKVITLHGRDSEGGERRLEEALAGHRKIAVLTDPAHTPAWIAEKLLEWGYSGAAVTVGEDLGAPSETVRTLTAKEARGEAFSPLNVVLIDGSSGQDVSPGAGKPAQVLGIPEEVFEHDAGLITKLEIRAVALACLRLEPGLVLWDIGAGSGSVSIEAARTARLALVAAVEKDARRYRKLVENVRDFRCPAVRPVCGSFAEALEGLPAPDRVFIGGSGGELDLILQKTSERLRASGRVVQTAVTLDTLDRVRSFWRKERFGFSVVQVQASRSSPIGKTVRLEALNPVFIMSAWRKT